MPEQQLREALSLARPKWSSREVFSVMTKLGKVGIKSTQDLAAAISVQEGRSLNEMLKEAGERAFSSDTMQQLIAYFQEVDRHRGNHGHPNGATLHDTADDVATTHMLESDSSTALSLAIDRSAVQKNGAAAARQAPDCKNPMQAYLEQQHLAQQGRSKQWQQAKFAKLLQDRELAKEDGKVDDTLVAQTKTAKLLQGRSSTNEEEKTGDEPAIQAVEDEDVGHQDDAKKESRRLRPVSWFVEQEAELADAVAPGTKGLSHGAGIDSELGTNVVNGRDASASLQEDKDSDNHPEKCSRHQSLDDILMKLDQEELQEQEEYDKLEAWAAEEGIIPSQLERVGDLRQLLERLSEIRKMTGSRLHNEYCKRGYAAFEGMSRQDLLPLVRDALVWESLNLFELQLICNTHGLEVAPEQPRSELIIMLANNSWEISGIPITRLPNSNVARAVLDRILDLDRYTPEELVLLCQRRGLPTEPLLASRLKRDMKRVIIWEHISLKELLRECRAEGQSVDVEASLSEAESRKILIQQLISSMWKDRLKSWKIPVNVLGHLEAEAIMERLDQLQVMSRLSLQSELRKHGVPFDTTMGSEEMVDKLREILIWKSTDIELLRQQCQESRVDDSGSHNDIIARLLKKRYCMERWASRGLPVCKIKNFSMTPGLSRDLETMEAMSTSELMQRYTDMGYPEEKAMQREELLKCLQTLLCWFEMPLEALQEQIRERGLVLDSNAHEKDALIELLLRQERMESWEARGYRAKLLGKFNLVIQVVAQIEFFIAMDEGELKAYYEETGLPLGDGSHDRFDLLKDVCVWEALPLQELLKECEKHFISTPRQQFDDDGQKRSFLVQALVVNKMKDSYISRGLPIDVLGIAEATLLVKRFDEYDAFNDQQIKEEFGVFGIPMPDDVETQGLVRFLQQMIIWISLPIATLWKSYVQKGLDVDGFDLQMPETELREQLLVRLILQWRANVLQLGLTTETLSTSARQHKQMRRYIQLMRDTIMCERLCGIPSKPLPKDQSLPASADDWTPLEAALFVLSSGIFDPSIERREREQSSEPLISVVCPTSTKRQHFHPLLYATFLRQTHEPKELVVVDTGPTPSKFFVEKAHDDPRVIYRHFIVDDAQIDPNPSKDDTKQKQIAWSLGLKRNIACYLANGVVIAQFDDDDLYAQNYLSWMWAKLQEVAPPCESKIYKEFPPAAIKLTEWHLLDVASSNFGYLDVESDSMIPSMVRRGWLYGWGFSYFFSRSAWEVCPFPDVEFAEDAGFYEGLMVHGVPVCLVRYPEDAKVTGLVAHSHHSRSTSGGSGTFADGLHGFDKQIAIPKQFLPLLPMVKRVHRTMDVESGATQPKRQRARFGEDNKQNGPLPMLKKSGGGVTPDLLSPGLAQPNHLNLTAKANGVNPWQSRSKRP